MLECAANVIRKIFAPNDLLRRAFCTAKSELGQPGQCLSARTACKLDCEEQQWIQELWFRQTVKRFARYNRFIRSNLAGRCSRAFIQRCPPRTQRYGNTCGS